MKPQDDVKNFKKYLQKGKYKECADILENKIINYISDLIKKKERDYEYTNILDLINYSEIYLDEENKYIASKIKFFHIEENDINRLERLLKLCETYNIK